MKDELKKLKNALANLEKKTQELAIKKEEFNKTNEALITEINNLQNEVVENKIIIRDEAESDYLVDGLKQRCGGIGIRVSKLLIYDDNKAFDWAKNHGLALTLDKKRFEQIAKDENLDFVKYQDNITVTFPKEIILEDD